MKTAAFGAGRTPLAFGRGAGHARFARVHETGRSASLLKGASNGAPP
jgi:hypothetical protein